MILNWLQTCVEAGADGFRFDAAKLIELPDDVSIYHPDYHFASDFWPTVLQNGASFQYGEALQEGEPNHRWQDVPNVVSGYNDEDSSRLHAYQDQTFLTREGEEKHFNTTLSFYGWRLRDAIHNAFLRDVKAVPILNRCSVGPTETGHVQNAEPACHLFLKADLPMRLRRQLLYL